MNMDYMLNPDKYHIPPPRLDGEKDEQYKLRLRAYSMGQQSQQAKIDELRKRIDDHDCDLTEIGMIISDDGLMHETMIDRIKDLLKGNKDD